MDGARNQLFARAGLSSEECGRVRTRNLADLLVDLPHHAALAHHVRVLELGIERRRSGGRHRLRVFSLSLLPRRLLDESGDDVQRREALAEPVRVAVAEVRAEYAA